MTGLSTMCKLRIAGMVNDSIVDGPGMRLTIFCQGCPHNCKGCHNKHTHDFKGGYDIDINDIMTKIKSNGLLSGVTFSGGEPMCQPKAFLELAKRIKAETNLNIICYSGYTIEELQSLNNQDINQLLDICDWLIDGRFEEQLKDLTLPFRGSSNQRIIELKNNTIEWTQ